MTTVPYRFPRLSWPLGLVFLLSVTGGCAELSGQPPAQEHVWIVGGGPTPESSEAQIEFNVTWVLGLLEELAPDAEVRVYYANGLEGGPSTHEWRPVSDADVPLHPLARVYGRERASGSTLRPHRVPGVLGSTRAEELLPALEAQFADLEVGDRAFFLYNGHGSWAADHSRNALRLWDESRLSVRDFEALLSRVDPEVPVRFIFTQCYSGAFERAVHPGAAEVTDLAPGQRCGFFAESEDRESEGCSAAIVIGDYRDYTTYFFAALSGRTRLGDPIDTDPDVDQDGAVDPFEAHLYALAEGYNSDLPRSTSEVFLERWQPWYLRWIGTDRIPDNEYGTVVRTLARAAGLPESGPALGRAAQRMFSELMGETTALTRERERILSEVAEIQETIREDVERRWPAAADPDGSAYPAFLESSAGEAAAFVARHAGYPELVRGQERVSEIDLELVDLDRRTARIERLMRSRLLARTLEQLERHGSDEDRAAYRQLRTCEATSLGG
jgi:hypothetical protein